MSAKTDKTKKRIICVVGMHRGGTSVITRGLQVLGVNLGDYLMPPAPYNNEKGFWEDTDFNRLNIEMLAHLGHDWHTLYPVVEEEVKSELWNAFGQKACDLIQLRLRSGLPFGVKDPRILRLLPFWNTVFIEAGADPSYIFVVRNPVSIVESLRKRDGFSATKSTYLWLTHIVTCLVFLQSKSRLFVEYEQMMSDPEEQLVRISNKLSLEAPDPIGLSDFVSDYLDTNLQHHSFTSEDISTLPCAVKMVEATYQLILGMARDELSPNTKRVAQRVGRLNVKMEALSAKLLWEARKESQSLMHGFSDLKSQLSSSTQQLKLVESKKDLLNAELVNKNEHIKTSEINALQLVETLSNRDEHISSLFADLEKLRNVLLKADVEIGGAKKTLLERDSRIDILLRDLKSAKGKVSYRNKRISAMKTELTQNGERIDGFVNDISSFAHEITSLNKLLTSQAEQLSELNQVLIVQNDDLSQLHKARSARDDEIATFNNLLDDQAVTLDELAQLRTNFNNVVSSLSWRVTLPIRLSIDFLVLRPLKLLRSLVKKET